MPPTPRETLQKIQTGLNDLLPDGNFPIDEESQEARRKVALTVLATVGTKGLSFDLLDVIEGGATFATNKEELNFVLNDQQFRLPES